MEKYEDTLKKDVRAYYGTILTQNNVTKVRHKRGIPEIHMSKKGSNTQLRPCNDMNGILGTFIPKRKVGIKISKIIGICQIFSNPSNYGGKLYMERIKKINMSLK